MFVACIPTPMRDAGLLGGVRDVSQVPILGMGLPTSPPGGGEDGGAPGEGASIPPLPAATRAAAYRAWLYESSLAPREENPAASFFSAFDELQIKCDRTYDKCQRMRGRMCVCVCVYIYI